MIISNIPGLSSMSTVKAKVDLYNGSTLLKTCTCGDVLSDFTVSREGDNSKFFGFGVCHKLDFNLIDVNRSPELALVAVGNTVEIGLGNGTGIWDAPYPTFYIDELARDEKTGTISGTAYDKIFITTEYSFDDLGLVAPYCFVDIAQAVATKLGIALNIDVNIYSAFRTTCMTGVNLDEGSVKDLRSVLNWLAEATQSIYFINYQNELVFKRLDKDGFAVAHITRDDYYELNTKSTKTLTAICSTTELGENLEASIDGEGVTQYIRSNPFIELKPSEELAEMLNSAIAAVGGTAITQFDCDWVGNYLIEIGDKLALTVEDGTEVYSYLLSDKVTYGGTLDEVTEWEYSEQKSETASNPTNIGEKISQTFAKVDKVNKRIELLVSDVSETKENVASLTMTTDAINLKVTEHEEKIEAFEELETGQIVDRMAQIEIELDGISATVSSNTSQIQSANTEIAGVKQVTNSNTTRLSAIETNIDSINLKVSNQSTKITTLEGTAQTQGVAINGLSEDVSELAGTTEEHTEQIGALEVNTSKISATVSNHTSQIQSTNNEVAGVKQTASSNSTKIGTIEASLEGINLTVSNQGSKITSLETTTKNQGDEIDGIAEDVGTLTETTETHTSQISQLQVADTNIRASVSANTSQINTVKDSVSELETTTEEHTTQISALQVSANEISATVTNITETSRVSTENIEEQIEQLTQEVSTKVSAEDLTINIRNELANGVDKVETTTGFTFNEVGLTIEKSGREMKTQITEDGMTVYKDTTAVLTADNTGVDAKNLKASTYLVIGTNSRFENYGTNRTACFWIGD